MTFEGRHQEKNEGNLRLTNGPSNLSGLGRPSAFRTMLILTVPCCNPKQQPLLKVWGGKTGRQRGTAYNPKTCLFARPSHGLLFATFSSVCPHAFIDSCPCWCFQTLFSKFAKQTYAEHFWHSALGHVDRFASLFTGGTHAQAHSQAFEQLID